MDDKDARRLLAASVWYLNAESQPIDEVTTEELEEAHGELVGAVRQCKRDEEWEPVGGFDG